MRLSLILPSFVILGGLTAAQTTEVRTTEVTETTDIPDTTYFPDTTDIPETTDTEDTTDFLTVTGTETVTTSVTEVEDTISPTFCMFIYLWVAVNFLFPLNCSTPCPPNLFPWQTCRLQNFSKG